MSYILDALKRADAERGQTQAPTPHEFQPVAMPRAGKAPLRLRPWLIALVVLVLCAALALAWRLWRASPAQAPMANAPSQNAPETATSGALPQPESNLVEKGASAVTASAARATAADAAAQAAKAPEPPKAPKAPVLPILAKAPPPPPPPTAEATSTKAAPSGPTTRPNAPPPLTATQRAALPAIEISGSSYSSNPAHRMLIANGQVIKEGGELSPGLTLEAIGRHSAIFNQRGTRFNVNY